MSAAPNKHMIEYLKMAGQTVGKTALRYFLGTCLPSSKQNAAKVKVPRLVFNDHIHMVSTVNINIYLHHILTFRYFAIKVIFSFCLTVFQRLRLRLCQRSEEAVQNR